MKINEKIKQLRALSSYSQAYVAEKLFISQRAYSDIENGKTKIDIDRLKDIAKLFDTSILDILTTSQNQEIYLQKIKHLESEVELLKERLNKEANHYDWLSIYFLKLLDLICQRIDEILKRFFYHHFDKWIELAFKKQLHFRLAFAYRIHSSSKCKIQT